MSISDIRAASGADELSTAPLPPKLSSSAASSMRANGVLADLVTPESTSTAPIAPKR